ncbi:Erythroid transcription factor [Coemansia aciculifera]|uniref:Erythroid transcription factor n=1 Tax=Coemansia aciculifera TaxID=417176 RepID=A0ACC1M6M5_9FUNG|nr:Erythroid transcription factor [Coemansia aciculifera]KAJ2909150.1 Erythroid transcription factor [Coemansia aciculifera]
MSMNTYDQPQPSQHQSASQSYFSHNPAAVYAAAATTTDRAINNNSQVYGLYNESQTTVFGGGDGGDNNRTQQFIDVSQSTQLHYVPQTANPFTMGMIPQLQQQRPFAPPRAGIKYCSVCNATETPTWRRHPGTHSCVCNACGLYHKLHGKDREFVVNARGNLVVKRQPRGTGKRTKARAFANRLNLVSSSAPMSHSTLDPSQQPDQRTTTRHTHMPFDAAATQDMNFGHFN